MSRKEHPAVESARVQLLNPAEVPAPGDARVKGAGPRNPDQRTAPVAKGPCVELPDGRPVMKAQRIWIDPELLLKWEEEHRREAAKSATTTPEAKSSAASASERASSKVAEGATTMPEAEPEEQEQPSDPPVKSP